MSDAVVGRTLDGRYRVERRLARGGMATVYQAVDLRLDRPVALKVMHPTLAEDTEFVERFTAEARSTARLSRHPAIVTLYDQGASDGLVWIALEMVHGRTLRAVLDERGRLEPRAALDVLEPVLTALAAAHADGIVHRDVKPENVLVGDDGQVQVADFGLSRAVDAQSTATRGATRGVVLGTIAYLSPERALGLQATPRSDVYSTGVVLYELLTGEPPHRGETDYVVTRKHVDEDVPAPSALVPEVAGPVEDLVLTATARDPQLRYPDAAVMLEALRQARAAIEHRTTPVPELTQSTEDLPLAPVPAPDAPRAPEEALVPVVLDAPAAAVEGPRRRRWLLPLLLLLGAGLAVGGWYLLEGRWTSTPTLVGMTLPEAEKAAARVGLQVEPVDEAFSETVPPDAVVGTAPNAGGRILADGTIRLTMSLGPERYEVPELSGLPLEDAEAALQARNLVLGDLRVSFSERVPDGAVIRQSVAPGTEVKRDTSVDVVASKGREPIRVPKVVGEPLGKASAKIEQAGLVARSSETFSTDVALGTVISQRPPKGELYRGDTVRLVVSKGPPIVTLPDVEGQSVASARAELEDLDLEVTTSVLLPAGPGSVLRQAPSEGSRVEVGSTVTLYVF